MTYELLTGRSHVDSEGEPEAAANLASLRSRKTFTVAGAGWVRVIGQKVGAGIGRAKWAGVWILGFILGVKGAKDNLP